MGHVGGGDVIDRYTKITAETQKQIREAVAVFDQDDEREECLVVLQR
jgi:hypothetical protein